MTETKQDAPWVLRRLGGNLAALSRTDADGHILVVTDAYCEAATLPPFDLITESAYVTAIYPSEAAWLGTETEDPTESILWAHYTYRELVERFPEVLPVLRAASLTLAGAL